MDYFRVEVTDNNRRIVMFRHTKIGEIMAVDDGEYVFFPKPQREGFVRSWLLKAVAEELDKLNDQAQNTPQPVQWESVAMFGDD